MQVEESACRTLITLDGDCTIFEAAELGRGLRSALEQAGDIDIDLSRVIEMDTSGIQLLLCLRHEQQCRGRGFRIRSLGDAAERLIKTYRLGAELKAEP